MESFISICNKLECLSPEDNPSLIFESGTSRLISGWPAQDFTQALFASKLG